MTMKHILHFALMVTLSLMPNFIFSQAPTLGTAANFVLFSTDGAVTSTGISQLTGNIGTNNGPSTGFGNVNGVMHSNDLVTAQCAADLLIAYNQLDFAIPTFFPSPLLGNGAVFNEGVYSVSGAAILDGGLTFNAQGDENAVFIVQIEGAFSTNANSQILLLNGAQACNIFWKVEGLVSMASGTLMKGTIIANNAAITMSTNNVLEGRALSTTGAITVDGVLSFTPIGCGSPELTGPIAPTLGETVCYALFSANGTVSNVGITFVTGDVGTNGGLATGFDADNVNGTIHANPDTSTALAASDLFTVNTYLTTLSHDIELLYPAQFGNELVLTPHTYLLNAATVLTNTLYLNAQDNEDAVFVIKIAGALSTSTFSNVVLINGAQSKNVYWKVDGATSISDYSNFKGTLVGHNGAVDLATGVVLDGRAFTTTGGLSTAAITAEITAGCTTLVIDENIENNNSRFGFYPNPFDNSLNITINKNLSINNASLIIFDVSGREVLRSVFTNSVTTFNTSAFASGMYFYKVIVNNEILQTGKLIAK